MGATTFPYKYNTVYISQATHADIAEHRNDNNGDNGENKGLRNGVW